MRRIIILTLVASLGLTTAAEAKSRKAHSQRAHASSHTSQIHTATAGRAGRGAAGKDLAALDDSKSLSAGAWIADPSFGGGKAPHKASGTTGFGLDTSGGHKTRDQTGLGYSTKHRRQRTS
jgi:hypothetical protein